ncbi:TerB N-terminal domain-containing protein [Comamonas sediminis]
MVAGSLITGGMIYVGNDLKTYSKSTDPCLINPNLTVAAQANLSKREFGYWPSYSQISPTARRAYLTWLAGGRRDMEADIGYVFLFFYGLERRAIVDGQDDEQARCDRPAIAQEIRRLLVIYGEKSYSFKRYASELLDWLEVADYSKQLYNEPVPTFPQTFELPLYIRLALGLTAVDAVPVPGHLALAWARMDPTSYLRTPATRCVEQFDKLFLQRYAEEFKQGVILPRNKTKLKLVYRPASAGFQGVNEIKLTFGDVPDVTVLTAPQTRLKKIVDAVSAELDPYSRYLGRNLDAAASLEALLLLPFTLWPPESEKAVNALKARIGSGMVVMTMQDLLDTFQAKAALNKDRAITLAKALESMQIGFEPDVLGGAKTPKPEDHIVLFFAPEPDTSQRRTSVYQAATLTLQLASAVASADGDFSVREMGHLREQVQAWTHLSPAQSSRLLAHLRLLVAVPVSLTSLKKKLEPLDTESKETIAAFMATVAQSDGSVTPAEVKILEKVYKALGLDAKKVFSDVHAVGTGATPTAGVLAKTESTGFQLDIAKIAALQKDSERVSALLADIFKDEAPAPTPPASEPELDPSDSESPPSGLFGLDETHSAFARMLLSRPQWSREELLNVASDLDLMLDGALERINEVSFDTHDIHFTEGEDPIDVNPEILEKLEA